MFYRIYSLQVENLEMDGLDLAENIHGTHGLPDIPSQRLGKNVLGTRNSDVAA